MRFERSHRHRRRAGRAGGPLLAAHWKSRNLPLQPRACGVPRFRRGCRHFGSAGRLHHRGAHDRSRRRIADLSVPRELVLDPVPCADHADAIERRLDDLQDLLVFDDRALAFETLRAELEAGAEETNTIPFYREGYDDLVDKARELVPLTAPDTYMRGAAEAVIEDRDACAKRHEQIGAQRAAAAACLEARAGLEARAAAEPPTGLEGYAAWSADCAEAAERVLEYDGRCRAVREFTAGVGEHGEMRNALQEAAARRRGQDPAISITDLAGYAPLSAFAAELVQIGETVQAELPAYGPHLDRLPGGREGFAIALGRLDWHGPLDRFVDVTGRIGEAKRIAAETGILAFHAPGYGAAMDDARDLAEERALEEEAARDRLQAELDEQAARRAEWLGIERLLLELDAIGKERRALEREAEREDAALSERLESEGWNTRHAEFAADARAALAAEELAEHWTSQPEVRERIERGIEGIFESRDLSEKQDRAAGEEQDRGRGEDATLDSAALAEDYPVRCRRDLVVGDMLCWTEPAVSDRLPGNPVPRGALDHEVRFEAELVEREAALDERDDRFTLEITRRSDEGLCGTAHMTFSMLAGSGCSRPFWDDEEKRRQEAEEQWQELEQERQMLIEKQQELERFQNIVLSLR